MPSAYAPSARVVSPRRGLPSARDGKPSLRGLREAVSALDAYDTSPVTVNGREGVVAVMPVAGPGGLSACAHVVVEGADGQPVCSMAHAGPGTGFADAVDMALIQHLASPVPLYRADGLIAPFVGDEAVRRQAIVDGLTGSGDVLAVDQVADLLAWRLSRALRQARFSARFRTGLIAYAACHGHAPDVFRQDRQGDLLRAHLVGYPLLALRSTPRSAPGGIAGVVLSLTRSSPGITAAHVRRLGGPSPLAWFRSLPESGRERGLLDAALRLAGAVPVDWMPRDAESFHAFARCAGFLSSMSRASGQSLRQLADPSKGRWSDFAGTLPLKAGRCGPLGITWSVTSDLACRVLLPMVGDLVEPIPDPDAYLVRVDIHAVTEALKEVAREALYAGKSAHGIMDAAGRLDALHASIQAHLPHAGNIRARWHPLFEPVTAPNGLRLVSLASSLDLVDEGAAGTDRHGVQGLDHCVAANAYSAAEGCSYFVSVRRTGADGREERVSTAHLIPSGPLGEQAVYQHRARRNAPPPPDAVEAVSWLVREHALAPWRATHRYRSHGGDHNLVAYACKYDWREPGFVEAALDAFRPALARRHAGLDVAGLRRALRLVEVVTPPLEERRRLRLKYTVSFKRQASMPPEASSPHDAGMGFRLG